MIPACDLVTLYAHADESHRHESELWRGFLVFLLPLLLNISATEAEALVEDAIVDSPEEALKLSENPQTLNQAIRVLSVCLAAEMGQPPEIGLAAFLDFRPPTRMFAAPWTPNQKRDDVVVSQWMQEFSQIPPENSLEPIIDSIKQFIVNVDVADLKAS